MEPTPPSNGVATLMADIARISQELRALNRRPLPATEEQVKSLVKLAERDRPLEVHVRTEEVVEQLVGKVEQLTAAFLAKCDRLIGLVDERTDYLAKQLQAGVAAAQVATAEMHAGAKLIPRSVAVKGNFYGFTNWQAGAVVGGVPVLLVLLMLWFTGMFSRVPAADFAQLQAEHTAIKSKSAKLSREGNYYLKQIKQYRAKNPKTTAFPAYVPAE